MKKTVAYYRSSTDLQENSIQMQRYMAQNCCYEKVLVINQEFVDEAVSARKKKIAERPGLSSLLAEIKNGNVANLLVYKRDRLARNVEEQMEIYYTCKEHGVNILFTSKSEMPVAYTPSGELTELIFAGINVQEGEQIAERIAAAKKANFYSGEYIGNLPYGYKVGKEKKIARIEEELEIVRFLYDEVLRKRHESVNELRKYLDEKQITRRGKKWNAQTIQKTICNPLYMGDHVLHLAGELNKKKYEGLQIVTEKEWETAQAVLVSTPIENSSKTPSENSPVSPIRTKRLSVLIP